MFSLVKRAYAIHLFYASRKSINSCRSFEPRRVWVAWVCGPETANRRSTAFAGFAQVNCDVGIILYIYFMTVEEYLNTAKDINLSELARKMWPNNVNADSYLYRKLSGARPFTQKDRAKALLILKELGATLSDLQ
jgi:hypothetical protein